jgi:hypothetical protein
MSKFAGQIKGIKKGGFIARPRAKGVEKRERRISRGHISNIRRETRRKYYAEEEIRISIDCED